MIGLERLRLGRLPGRTDTTVVTYDLFILPADRPLTADEAAAIVDRSGGFPFGIGHDKRLDPFIASMERRYGRLRGVNATPPFEFDVVRSHVFIGIPWIGVQEIVTAVGEAAFEAGVAVWDPQRAVVGLPAPLGEAPMTADGTEVHVHRAEVAFAAIEQGAAAGDPGAIAADPGAMASESGDAAEPSEEVRRSGFPQMSPLGFEVTPALAAEFAADPRRMPTSLQTPELRDALLAALVDGGVGDRHKAITRLAGWDPDPAVATALRPLLASDDVFSASRAASGLARQQDITDLPALLDLVYRLSPADGGTAGSMLEPLRATLDLAVLAGPEIVEGVRSRARTWRTAGSAARRSWERDQDRELDLLLEAP
jgi:hypothetical protein